MQILDRHGQSVVASSWELYLFRLPPRAPELRLCGDLSKTIMCSFLWQLLNRQKKTNCYLLCLDLHGPLWVWNDTMQVDVGKHFWGACQPTVLNTSPLNSFERHIPSLLICFWCVGRKSNGISSMSTKTLICSAGSPLLKTGFTWIPLVVYYVI